MKKFKFLLLLILIIPFINIKAITFCDNTELPDIPLDSTYTNYVIIEYVPSTVYRAIVFRNSASVYISNNTIYFNDSNFIRIYTLSNNSWGIAQTYQNRNFSLASNAGNIIFATTIDIFDSSTNDVIYNANYNIECFIPTPDTPQDFSLINTIASYINTFITDLQNNNISIEVTFISLIIFNFLVFVICYIITHLE